MSMGNLTLTQIFIWVLPVLFAVTFHEVSHGFIASLLGDKTAAMLGRLTLNPLKHINLVRRSLCRSLVCFWGVLFLAGPSPCQ